MFCSFPCDRLFTSAAIACCFWLQLRIVIFYLRQQDQALQSQRHTALQRLNHLQCTAAARQQIVSGRADAHLPVLVRRCVYSSGATLCHTIIGVKEKPIKDTSAVRSGGTMPPNLLKDAMLLADRARSEHVHVREGTASTVPRRMLSRPATSAAVV